MTASVRVRCTKCRRVLGVATRENTSEGEDFWFTRCRKCDIPPPGRLIQVLVKTGRQRLHLKAALSYDQIESALRSSESRGRPTDIDVRVADPGDKQSG